MPIDLATRIANHAARFHGTASVILRVKVRGVADADDTVENSLKRAPNAAEVEAGIALLTDVVWSLPANKVTTAPKRGDQIIHGSDTWVIKAVVTATLATRYRCICNLGS